MKAPEHCTFEELEPYAREWFRRKRAMQKPPTEKVKRPCPHCRKRFGARDLRVHIPQCPKNKRARINAQKEETTA